MSYEWYEKRDDIHEYKEFIFFADIEKVEYLVDTFLVSLSCIFSCIISSYRTSVHLLFS